MDRDLLKEVYERIEQVVEESKEELSPRAQQEVRLLDIRTVRKVFCIQCGETTVRLVLGEKGLEQEAASPDLKCAGCGSIFKGVPDSMVWN